MFATIRNINPMRRQFGHLQNLPQDLRSFGRFCGPQTIFAWDLDNIINKFKLTSYLLSCVQLISYGKAKKQCKCCSELISITMKWYQLSNLQEVIHIHIFLNCLKVAFFRKCDSFFRSPNLKKKYSKKTILSLKFKFPANNIE